MLGVVFTCMWAQGVHAQDAPSSRPRPLECSSQRESNVTASEVWTRVGATWLYAVELGSGPALIILHGGLTDHRAVLPLVRPLAEHYRVVVPDIRSSGRSRYSGTLSFDQLTRDLEAILDRLGIASAFVGGISSGTGPAIHFAMNRPGRSLGLIVMQPVYAGAARGYTEEQRVAFGRMDAVAGRAPDEGVVVLREMFYAELLPEVAERAWAIASVFDPGSVATTSRFIASGVQPFQSASDLESLRLPVLVGRADDPVHPRSVSDLYARSISNVRVEDGDWPGCALTIRAFLDDVVRGLPPFSSRRVS